MPEAPELAPFEAPPVFADDAPPELAPACTVPDPADAPVRPAPLALPMPPPAASPEPASDPQAVAAMPMLTHSSTSRLRKRILSGAESSFGMKGPLFVSAETRTYLMIARREAINEFDQFVVIPSLRYTSRRDDGARYRRPTTRRRASHRSDALRKRSQRHLRTRSRDPGHGRSRKSATLPDFRVAPVA